MSICRPAGVQRGVATVAGVGGDVPERRPRRPAPGPASRSRWSRSRRARSRSGPWSRPSRRGRDHARTAASRGLDRDPVRCRPPSTSRRTTFPDLRTRRPSLPSSGTSRPSTFASLVDSLCAGRRHHSPRVTVRVNTDHSRALYAHALGVGIKPRRRITHTEWRRHHDFRRYAADSPRTSAAYRPPHRVSQVRQLQSTGLFGTPLATDGRDATNVITVLLGELLGGRQHDRGRPSAVPARTAEGHTHDRVEHAALRSAQLCRRARPAWTIRRSRQHPHAGAGSVSRLPAHLLPSPT